MNLTRKEKEGIYKVYTEIEKLLARVSSLEYLMEKEDLLLAEIKNFAFDEVVNICELKDYKGRYFVCKKDAYSNITNTHIMDGDGRCPETCKQSLRDFRVKRVKVF